MEQKDPTRPAALWNDAWRGVLFASAKVLRIAELDLIERDGFPLSWLDILAQLVDAPGIGLRMQELEERSLFTRSGLTRLVDRIEAAGLVRREPVPGDRRGVRVVLTPEGRRRHDDAFVGHLRIIEREFGTRLSLSQQRAVADALAGFWRDDRAIPAYAEDTLTVPAPSDDRGRADLPLALGAPALRALDAAGYRRLEDLTVSTEAEILRLHGMGPKALRTLRALLAERGLSFAEPSTP